MISCCISNNLQDLINSKANSLKVAVKLPLPSSILLHQPHQKGAPIRPIHRVIIHIFQTHHELRVGREGRWSTRKCMWCSVTEFLAHKCTSRGFSVTWVITAAASSGAHPPHAFKLVVVPVAHVVTHERVRGQVTDLQLREMLEEVWIGHPGKRKTFLNTGNVSHESTSDHLVLGLLTWCCYSINKLSKIVIVM